MQGKLSEIDIRSILQLVELGQRTGELLVESYAYQSPFQPANTAAKDLRLADGRLQRVAIEQSWFVFFLNGEIIYATQADGTLSRLRDYLVGYDLTASLEDLEVLSPVSSIAAANAPEYGYLWALLANHSLTPAQGRAIIRGMVQETLFDLLSLHQGSFTFELGSALAPQLTAIVVAPIVLGIAKQIQEWKALQPYVQSPEQCFVVADAPMLVDELPVLARYVDATPNDLLSIRQLARRSGKRILDIGRIVYPYVQKNSLQLFYPSGRDGQLVRNPVPAPSEFTELVSPKIPRIVCIDDGLAIRKSVEAILVQHGYEAAAIGNPVKALSLVFQLKPDLILCDIAMPDLDGYEICAMLRHSTMFRQTPIVMLTGKDGFIDRAKARMVGATDYLTKPFGQSELLMLVEKHVGLGDPNRPKPNELLANALNDELAIELDATSTVTAF